MALATLSTDPIVLGDILIATEEEDNLTARAP
jgi:hypothetical protein